MINCDSRHKSRAKCLNRDLVCSIRYGRQNSAKERKKLLNLVTSMTHLAIHAQSALRVDLLQPPCNDEFIIDLFNSDWKSYLETLEFTVSDAVTDDSRKAWQRFSALRKLKMIEVSTQMT